MYQLIRQATAVALIGASAFFYADVVTAQASLFCDITDKTDRDDLQQIFKKVGPEHIRDVLVNIPDAAWLQLGFDEYDLGEKSRLIIRDVNNGDIQTFTQKSLFEWGGQTALFNDGHLRVQLDIDAEEKGEIYFKIGRVTVAYKQATQEAEQQSILKAKQQDTIEVIFGGRIIGSDDRILSHDKRVARLMPVGCTAWIVGANTLLSAGHCVVYSGDTTTLQFNVPLSKSNGTINQPLVKDQYGVKDIEYRSTRKNGNDWAVFRAVRNTQTGLLPGEAQGEQFYISNTQAPIKVSVTGYGYVCDPLDCKDDGEKNQAQQTGSGEYLGFQIKPSAPNNVSMQYLADTSGGNSGSPVISADTGVGLGIHQGKCEPEICNMGTSFRNKELWETIQRYNSSSDDDSKLPYDQKVGIDRHSIPCP